MKVNTATISASEAAYFLQKHLGSYRAWGDFLSDNVRGLQSVFGMTLPPCARLKRKGKMRPRYAIQDILAFIKAVKALIVTSEKIKPVVLAIERRGHWELNKFREDGTSCRHQTRITRPRKTARITA